MSIAEAEAEAETVDTVPSHWEVVLRAWEQLDPPEGWRAEIIEGDVVKVPFGKDIHLPEPFDLTLDTSGFPA